MDAVIFDLDGTLLDSAPDIAASAETAMTPEGGRALSVAETRRFVGRGARAFLVDAVQAVGLGGDSALFDRVEERFHAAYAGAVAHSALYPGVIEALDALSTAGHPLGLCTNKPLRAVGPVLSHFDLARRMRAVVGGDTLPVSKPDPAPLVETMRRMGVTRCLYVGDSETDAETAARAEMPFLLFTGGYRKSPAEEIAADLRFDAWADLPGHVARWES